MSEKKEKIVARTAIKESNVFLPHFVDIMQLLLCLRHTQGSAAQRFHYLVTKEVC